MKITALKMYQVYARVVRTVSAPATELVLMSMPSKIEHGLRQLECELIRALRDSSTLAEYGSKQRTLINNYVDKHSADYEEVIDKVSNKLHALFSK